MDSNTNFDTLWNQFVDKQLEDNTKEEVVKLILESQQVNITIRLSSDKGSICEGMCSFELYNPLAIIMIRSVGLSLLQKCITTICILAYGSPIDNMDDYVRIGKHTTMDTIFRDEYLKRLNNQDIEQLL
ncbi:hypothetical protein CR513_17815, partial [Mucuna pruriens]